MLADHMIALRLYTGEKCFPLVNRALMQDEKKKTCPNLKPYIMLVSFFIQGFRLLPSWWGRVYRAMKADEKKFETGQVVLFKGFTSTSKNPDIVLQFMEGP